MANAKKTATVDYTADKGFVQVFGNFAATDVIVPTTTANPKKSGSKAAAAYQRFLDLYNEKQEKGEAVTFADSVAAGNAGFRVKWDADAERNIVKVYRKVG